MTLTMQGRMLLTALTNRSHPDKKERTTRVYNTRPNFSNLALYRELERAGKIEILSVKNATTENMLYGMSFITFTLKGN